MSPTFRLVLEYDGARFAGWQAQAKGSRTVQATVEEAILRLTGAPVAVVGASRTDAGVHAEGQVASVGLETELGPAALVRALNALQSWVPSRVAAATLIASRSRTPGTLQKRPARRGDRSGQFQIA